MACGGGIRDVWNVPFLDLGGGFMRVSFMIKHWAGYLFCALFCICISAEKILNEGKKVVSFKTFFFFFGFKEKSWLSSTVILKAAYYRKLNKFLFINCSVTLFIYFPLSLSTPL